MISSGFYSLFYSVAKKPLEFWSKQYSETGRVRKILDLDLQENVLEIQDLYKPNNSSTFIVSPDNPNQILDVRLPILVFIIKNMNVECRFQVQILDNNQNRRFFQFSNDSLKSAKKQTSSNIIPVEVKLTPGWNRLEIDLNDLTQRVFRSEYKATQRLAIYANCRLRRIYFVDKHYIDSNIEPNFCRAFFEHYITKRGIYLTQKSDFVNRKARNNSQFVKRLETKLRKLINEFCNDSKNRIDNYDEFKNQMMRIFSSYFSNQRATGY